MRKLLSRIKPIRDMYYALLRFEKRQMMHKLEKKGGQVQKRQNTSMSDNGSYPTLCLAAARDDAVFANFKSHPCYRDILENVSEDQGQQYLEVIKSHELFTDADYDEFQKNDDFGNPIVFTYNILGQKKKFSPTTLRYIKVLQDFILLFDTESIKQVAEIGVGYGGQCRILLNYLKKIERYYLIDIPETLALVKKCLGRFPVENRAVYLDGTKISEDDHFSVDFVVSNYAFSELTREVQDMYLKSVILNSKAGYITWNQLSEKALNGYTAEDILKIIPDAFVIPEEPLTYEGNCIIIWGAK